MSYHTWSNAINLLHSVREDVTSHASWPITTHRTLKWRLRNRKFDYWVRRDRTVLPHRLSMVCQMWYHSSASQLISFFPSVLHYMPSLPWHVYLIRAPTQNVTNNSFLPPTQKVPKKSIEVPQLLPAKLQNGEHKRYCDLVHSDGDLSVHACIGIGKNFAVNILLGTSFADQCIRMIFRTDWKSSLDIRSNRWLLRLQRRTRIIACNPMLQYSNWLWTRTMML